MPPHRKAHPGGLFCARWTPEPAILVYHFRRSWSEMTRLKEDTVSLPITVRQLNALRALQRIDPDLGELATAIALAFDPTNIENPQMARLILENTCRRIVAGQPGSHEVMIEHLERFGDLNCLSPEQVTDFTDRIRKHA
jgi:hypothetical protein